MFFVFFLKHIPCKIKEFKIDKIDQILQDFIQKKLFLVNKKNSNLNSIPNDMIK